jgi:hypothetical protein
MDVGWEKETDEPMVTDVEVSKIGYGVCIL